MPKNIKRNPYVLYSLHLPVIALALAIFAVSIFSSSKITRKVVSEDSVLGSESKSGKNDKSSNTNEKGNNDKTKNETKTNKPVVEDYETNSNAKKYKENMTTVVSEINTVADEEETVGNTETSDELAQVAESEEEISDEVAEIVEEVEARPAWKNLLSPDYKNLGQLRSALSHSTNNIRKLVKAINNVEGETADAQLQEQLQVMLQERHRIVNVIVENESQFSILGWVYRFLEGYTPLPIGSPIDDDVIDAGTEPGDPLDSGTEPGDPLDSGTEPDDIIDAGTQPDSVI